MRIVIDIEADKLIKPTQIWCIVCKDIDTDKQYIFRNVTLDEKEKNRFKDFANRVTLWIGHNFLGYDYIVLRDLLAICIPEVSTCCIDTFIVSKLVDYPRTGHSIEAYGIEFNFLKGKNYYLDFFKKWSQELEDYCVRDVDICHRIYLKYLRYIDEPLHTQSIKLEHSFQLICNDLQSNGFGFNSNRARSLLKSVTDELAKLDKEIQNQFPPKDVIVRYFTPRPTKFGTISRTSIPKSLRGNIHNYECGKKYPIYARKEFNPASHKQVIEVLNEAGWAPTVKTQTHIDIEREINHLKYTRNRSSEVDTALAELYTRIIPLGKYGWKISEENLSSLPESAPAPARTLAKRILYEARRRTLVEWINLVCLEIKINVESIVANGLGKSAPLTFHGSRQNANITEPDGEKDLKKKEDEIILDGNISYPSKTLIEWLKNKKVNVRFVKESADWLWITITPAEKSEDFSASAAIQILDGLKAKGLQYKITSERIRGHFQGIGAWTHRMAHQKPNTANIPNEIKNNGKVSLLGKEMRSLWQAPRNRLLVGVDAEGIQLRIFAHYIDDKEFTEALVKGKKDDQTDPHSLNARILGKSCKGRVVAKRFIYALLLGAGIGKLTEILGCSREEAEAALGRLMARYQGFDYLKRSVIPADAKRGYFIGLDGRTVRIPGDTAGERKHLCMSGYLQNGETIIMKRATVKWYELLADTEYMLVNLVHDEWQTEVANNMEIALHVAAVQANSLKLVGEELNLKCPLAGSYWNDDKKDYTIGTNWYSTH